jgi:oxygen-independent coproporphyrinogen-3 oxidase
MILPQTPRGDRPITRSPDHPVPCGLYLHLPYCLSRCGYCSFVVSTDTSSAGRYREALEREMALLAPDTQAVSFDSVYFGGGTPSLTPAAGLGRLLDRVRSSFGISRCAEITMEANPEDVSEETVGAWIAAGVTRVSVGVQSFDDRELAAVGRRHDAGTARRALAIVAAGGLSFSADLILGLPGQTAATFRRSLDLLCATGAGHISVYMLETEKPRSIEEDRRLRPSRYLGDDAQADLWLEMAEELRRAGYGHYEISNWALPGRESRHNLKYWRRVPTLGLGVSAHELWEGRRRANVASLPTYIDELAAGRRPLALDRPVGPGEEARELVVLGLRLAEGVAAGEVERLIRESGDRTLPEDYAAWKEWELLEEAAGRVWLTERGFLLSNEILCRFV